jgi:hypothetical protein
MLLYYQDDGAMFSPQIRRRRDRITLNAVEYWLARVPKRKRQVCPRIAKHGLWTALRINRNDEAVLSYRYEGEALVNVQVPIGTLKPVDSLTGRHDRTAAFA